MFIIGFEVAACAVCEKAERRKKGRDFEKECGVHINWESQEGTKGLKE
jgi:hypothetical protein